MQVLRSLETRAYGWEVPRRRTLREVMERVEDWLDRGRFHKNGVSYFSYDVPPVACLPAPMHPLPNSTLLIFTPSSHFL